MLIRSTIIVHVILDDGDTVLPDGSNCEIRALDGIAIRHMDARTHLEKISVHHDVISHVNMIGLKYRSKDLDNNE